MYIDLYIGMYIYICIHDINVCMCIYVYVRVCAHARAVCPEILVILLSVIV